MVKKTTKRMKNPLYLDDARVVSPVEAIDLLLKDFAANAKMRARLEALRGESEEAQSAWLLARPDRDRAASAGCAIVIVWVIVTIIVGYEYYQVWNEHLKRMEQRKRAITEERKEAREKEVCPDDED